MLPGERAVYERYLINTAIERDIINTAKEEGEQLGLKKSEELGLKKGKELTAINLLNLNVLSVDQISQVSGLSTDEIKSLIG